MSNVVLPFRAAISYDDQVGVYQLYKQCVLPPSTVTAAGDDVAGGQRVSQWCSLADIDDERTGRDVKSGAEVTAAGLQVLI
jgi:hypothetical protein